MSEHTVVELCAGQGRNIYNILRNLKPSKYIAIDFNEQAVQEILERWNDYSEC